MIKTYFGDRDKNGIAHVWVTEDGDSLGLPLRHDLVNHSVSFEWGYLGSGPAQLALALLADAEGDALAKHFYQQFKVNVIARLPRSAKWKLTQPEVSALLSSLINGSGPERLLDRLRKLKDQGAP